MNETELFFKEHFKEIKQLADNNNKITLACKYLMLKEYLKKKIKRLREDVFNMMKLGMLNYKNIINSINSFEEEVKGE